jgi:RNA polymerase-associated protein RTF1
MTLFICSYTYTAEDVAKLLHEKRARGQAPRNLALERARLEREHDAATEAGDEEAAALVAAQIAELNVTTAAASDKATRLGISMADLNKRNAEANFQAAFMNVSNAVDGGVGLAGVAGKASLTLDPFSRRATRPMVYWKTGRRKDGG